MFNLNNKNTTIRKALTVKTYSSFFGRFFVGMFFVGIYLIASKGIFAYWWLDTKIQSALDTLRPQDAIQDLYWSTKMNGKVDVNVFKNMYTKAYRLAGMQKDATEIQTIAFLKVEIMNTYKCELTDKEADNLFKDEGKTVTANECLPLIHCRDGASYKEKKKKDVSNTELNSCKAFVTNKYAQTYKAVYDSATLINTTLGTDTYANGTLEDGWYDILYDIQKIWDILFAENDQTAKTLFFSFPNGSIAWLQAIQFGDTTTNNGLPKTTTITKDKDTSTASNETDARDWNRGRDWTAGTDWVGAGAGARAGTAIENPNITNSETSNIANYACMPATPKDDSNTDNIDGKWDDAAKSENDISSKNNTTGRPTGVTIGINERPTDRQTQNESAIVSNTDRDNSTSMADNQEQVKTCIKKCTDGKWSFSDKVFCIAKCSCTTKRTDNWMAWISICMVPTSQTDVLARKPIQSVQEIIKEINNVLTALKNSWELIKHNKTTEFLDTSLSKIQLNKIFAFDINISMKPIFAVTPKKKDTAKNETQSDRMANGGYPDIDIGKEKNKYAFYWNNWLTGSRTADAEDANQAIKALNTIQESQSQALIKTQNAQIIEGVRGFILDNIVYWDSVAEIISSIQKTSDQIKQKIINK